MIKSCDLNHILLQATLKKAKHVVKRFRSNKTNISRETKCKKKNHGFPSSDRTKDN